MIGQLTDAGVAALQGSTLVTITQAKLGDAYNYIPAQSDTDLHGNLVWTDTPSAPMAVNANIVRWSVFLDANVGPFQFGEIGLYLPNGDLFALFAADVLIDKIPVGGSNQHNEINILIFVSMVGDNYVIWLDLGSTNNQLQVARANSPDQLPQPKDAYPNIYIMPGADVEQQSILAVTDRQGLWAFGGYDNANTMHGTVVGFDSLSITIDAADYNPNMDPEYFGQLILQFTSGTNFGVCRYIKTVNVSGSLWRLNFNTPMAVLPAVGDTFSIQSRNPLTLDRSKLPVATRTLPGVVIPSSETLTLDAAGNIGVDWTKLSIGDYAFAPDGTYGPPPYGHFHKVAFSGNFGDLNLIPAAFPPYLAGPTVIGGVKIAPGTGLYLDTDNILHVDVSGSIPEIRGLINPTMIAAGGNLNDPAYRVPGIFWTLDRTSIANAPEMPIGPAVLEAVPVSGGGSPGMVVQIWAQAEGIATRVVTNGTTATSWSIQTLKIATTAEVGVVAVGDGLGINGTGHLYTKIQTINGKNPDSNYDVALTADDIGAVSTDRINRQGGVAGLDADNSDPPMDETLANYVYGRIGIDQLPLGGWVYVTTWDAATNVATVTNSGGTSTTTYKLKNGGMMEIWGQDPLANPGDPDILLLTVPANGKIFKVATAGTTALDGINNWAVGDLAIAVGDAWYKIGTPSPDTMIEVTVAAGATTPLTVPPWISDPIGATVTVRVKDQITTDWYDATGTATLIYNSAGINLRNDYSASLTFRYRFVRG